jgi:O-antigen/teichoic acid export membrane protein
VRVSKVLAGQALTYVAQAVSVFLIASLLGPAGQGDYAILRTAVYLGETFMWFGLNTGLGYLIASNPERYHHPLLKVSLFYLGAVAVVLPAATALVGALPHPRSFDPILAHSTPFATWLVTLALLQVLLRVFVAQRRFDLYNGINLLNCLALFPALIVAARFFGLTPTSVAFASASANAIAVAAAMWQHRDALSSAARKPLPGLLVMREAYAVGIKAYLSTIAFLALYRVDFFFVAHFLGKEVLGVYTVGVFAIEAIQKVPEWLGLMLTPFVAADPAAAGPRTRRYVWLALGVVAIVALPIVASTGLHVAFVHSLLGDAYAGVGHVVLLLLPKTALHAVMVIYAAYLAGRGYTRYHPLAGATALIVLIALDLILIPRMGVPGAVAGITVAYIAATVVVFVGYRELVDGAQLRAAVRPVNL